MKITNRNSLYNAVNKLIRIYKRRMKNRKNIVIYEIAENYEGEYYKQSIEEKKIIDAIIEYLEKYYHYADGINWEKTKILKEYDEDIDEEQDCGIWIEETTTDYSEDSYYGTITIKIPKNKKYVQFDYYI